GLGKIDAPRRHGFRHCFKVAPVGFKRIAGSTPFGAHHFQKVFDRQRCAHPHSCGAWGGSGAVSAVSAGSGVATGGAIVTGFSFEAGVAPVSSRVSGSTKLASAYIAP